MTRLAIPAALLSAGLLVSACGSTDTATGDVSATSSMSAMPAESPAPATSPAADHNDRDIWFAQMMIPHHRQALEMAKLAEDRAGSSKVKELAKQIEAAQGPEIQTMTGWLESWGVQAPGEDAMPMDHMDHGMPGMMSGEDMKRLEGLKGAAFDKAFLTMMIQHHEGAITMAKEEREAGVYEPAKQMAGSIMTSQSAEISTMKKLLK
ncbi:Uncharacterized conserved protein, DUF305 family [Microbispora rosea]|uniref:Uncharacterized conserved protein, DUF305 family n=1 Tax=Microbispora rosea TaxID=58117 RepID=A0A1N7EHW4_9ACTN|nr:DUF305 domain-containing protein [Microbispora rosea]GIH49927.1 hypothetical protein Mro03_51060 [Microbispora rosea subsp. rosea]SIR87599.1 Uncharacterized conserved protein, DUF305 family [Microbispora rosea]